MSLVFLDTETTGLDPYDNQIWEIAYAVDNCPVQSGFVVHTLTNATEKALQINGYRERFIWDKFDINAADIFEWNCRRALQGNTLVGANPAFDTSFLRARWGSIVPWHYRLLDVEVYAMPALGHDTPQGLYKIAEQLGVDAPDHTAAGDVTTTRQVFYKLREFYAGTTN